MKIVSAILGIALVLASGVAIHLWRVAGMSQEKIAQLEARLQQQSAELAARPITQATQAPTASVPAPPTKTPASEPAPAAVAAQLVPTPAPPELVAVLKEQIASPETAARTQAFLRTMLAGTYPDLREVLGLSADEAEKLLDLVAANSASISESAGAPGDASISPQERVRAMTERSQANEAALRAMLGSKYPQWKEYDEARPAYQQRRDLRAVLDAAGTPLTAAQDKALLAALVAEQRNFDQQTREAMRQGKPLDLMARNSPERHQQLLAAASPHLSPQQLESYRGMLDRAARQRAVLMPGQVNQSVGAPAR
jgi:hypothetical protein